MATNNYNVNKSEHNSSKKNRTTRKENIIKQIQPRPARSYFCLSSTSLKVIEEPYRVSFHCFNTPRVAYCLDDSSSKRAQRSSVWVGNKHYETTKTQTHTNIKDIEMCVFVLEKTFVSLCQHWSVCVAASYCGQISLVCTGLRRSLPSSAQWRKSSPRNLQGLYKDKHTFTNSLIGQQWKILIWRQFNIWA